MALCLEVLYLRLLRLIGCKVVFVSYRRSDASHVSGRLYDRLREAFGRSRVFQDIHSIPLGVDFAWFIERVIPACNVMVVVISPGWNDPDEQGLRPLDDPDNMVRKEIAWAFEHGLRIIPVLVGGASLPDKCTLPDEIKGLTLRQATQLRDGLDFRFDVERLVAGIRGRHRAIALP